MQHEPDLSVITCSIDLHFPPDEVGCGLQLLLSSVGVIESKTGCQACEVSRDAADETRIHYKETWTTEAMFQRHARSAEFQRVLVAMDMCSEAPEVVIGEFSGHTGLAHLQELCDRRGAEDSAQSAPRRTER